jgi:hypothetical protein
MRLQFRGLALAGLVAGAMTGAPSATHAQGALYNTGFEPPTFRPGLLAGQDGWFAGLGPAAATISTALPRSGIQSVRIAGAQTEEVSGFFFGSYARALSYDPLASGTPLVRLSASMNLIGSVPTTCGLSIGLTGAPSDLPNILLGLMSAGGGLVAYISNADGISVEGPHYQPGDWASVSAVFDFGQRSARAYFNGAFFGEVPLTSGVSDDIRFMNIALGSSRPIPDVVGYVDDFSVSAVPEPTATALLSAGLVAIAAAARRRRKGTGQR